MRRPVSNERLGKALADRDTGEVNAGIQKVIANTAERLGLVPDGSSRRSSKRGDHLDEPSTPSNKKPPAPKKFSFQRKPLADAVTYGKQIAEGLWEAGHPRDLVGLYAFLHQHVFQVLPLELEHDYMAACSSAAKLVKDEFAGDCVAAQQFVRWCWARLVKQRKKNPDSDFRPGWRIQFKSRTWLTDWKASGRG